MLPERCEVSFCAPWYVSVVSSKVGSNGWWKRTEDGGHDGHAGILFRSVWVAHTQRLERRQTDRLVRHGGQSGGGLPCLSGSGWRTAVVVVGVSSILGKSLSLVLSYGKFKVTCG